MQIICDKGIILMKCTFKKCMGAPMQAFTIVMNEKYKDNYNIHSKVCMNTLSIFFMYCICIQTWMNVDE